MDPSIDPRLEAEAKARGEKSYELVAPYLITFPYENVSAAEVPSDLYDISEDDEDEYGSVITVVPNPHEKFMRFLKQVRESNGYDVDCCPPQKIYSPFLPVGPTLIRENQRFREKLMRVTNYVIDKINISETMTMKTLRAMLYVPFGHGNEEPELQEWRLEPPTPAADKSPEQMEPVKKKAKIEEGKDSSG